MSMFRLAMALLLVATGPGWAADGQIEINQASASASGFPVVLSQPGSYLLTSDLQVPQGDGGIRLLTSDISLDLGGFRISGPSGCDAGQGECAEELISAATGQGDRVTLRNGTVRGSSESCIELDDLAHVTGLLVLDCGKRGIDVGDRSLVTDNRVSLTGEDGIRLGTDSGYARNVVSRAGELGPASAIVGGRAIGGNLCDDDTCSARGARRYFLTTNEVVGEAAQAACGPGFRVARLWEIHDPSSLEYDFKRGLDIGKFQTASDAFLGWMYAGSDVHCGDWTGVGSFGQGRLGILVFDLSRPPDDLNHWSIGSSECDFPRAVWCVEE
ncbi:MAG: hypothetical protein QNK05_20180 [Myxococcota bacterium]|nr:hypothetical protein [Myxococcota bacterium]